MEPISPTSKKRRFKLFEHSLSQFNDVVIPHRLDMMGKHKSNIEKAIVSRDYQLAIREQSAAQILVQNLRRDLAEIEALRNQVDEHDLMKFDDAMRASRSRALAALEEYIRLGEKLAAWKQSKTEVSDENVLGTLCQTVPQLQVQKGKQIILEEDVEQYVRSWEKLQMDIESLHSCYADLHALTEMQGEIIDSIEENVSVTGECVSQAEKNLKTALKYKATMYPLVGAALGTLVGGPVGLVIGLKAGGCAAVGGGLLGFVGGRLLKKINSTNKTEESEACLQADVGQSSLSSKPRKVSLSKQHQS